MAADRSDQPVRQRFEPEPSPAGRPFWAATVERRFVLPWCASCGRPHWYPREACPFCLDPAIEWREASGHGVVHARSTMPKAAQPLLAARVPYVVALVDLDEGVRLLTNLVGPDAHQLPIGAAVELEWEPLSDGRALPLFRRREP
jgi:uncharacterized OB-fold protein